ncbi:MAG: hypothetical protein D6785_08505, partial [Planctomycetota bacterium]
MKKKKKESKSDQKGIRNRKIFFRIFRYLIFLIILLLLSQFGIYRVSTNEPFFAAEYPPGTRLLYWSFHTWIPLGKPEKMIKKYNTLLFVQNNRIRLGRVISVSKGVPTFLKNHLWKDGKKSK